MASSPFCNLNIIKVHNFSPRSTLKATPTTSSLGTAIHQVLGLKVNEMHEKTTVNYL